jgi:hypothetical protein
MKKFKYSGKTVDVSYQNRIDKNIKNRILAPFQFSVFCLPVFSIKT